MTCSSIYISHDSALHFWRTNPPAYILEGADRNIRVLRRCPTSDVEVRDFGLSELEFGPRPIDVLVPPGAPCPRSILRYHEQKTQLPPRSLYPLRDGIHLVSPALCFVEKCASLPFIEALELGMELCGTYALRPDETNDYSPRNYQLTSVLSLNRKTKGWQGIHGLKKARVVVLYLADGAASPMETKVYLLLCLPQKYGGFNIEKPEINVEMQLTEEERRILRQLKVKPDFFWRDAKLIVEYDGEYHNDPVQAAKDAKRNVLLESLGYTVVSIKKQQVYDPLAFDNFASMVAEKTGRRIRPLTAKQHYARENLRDALLASDPLYTSNYVRSRNYYEC